MSSESASDPESAGHTSDRSGGPEVTAPTDNINDSGVGRSYVGPFGIAVVAASLLAATSLVLYGLVAVWPTSASTGSAASQVAGVRLLLDRDQRLFLIVAMAGFLGGLIHSVRSLYEYVGSRLLRRSWLLMYLSLPFIGGALAVVFYVILRGGLITGTAAQVNFFGFASIAALVGLFSPEAAEKLKQVFSTLLAPAPRARDTLIADDEPLVLSVEPSSGTIGTTVRIRGRNLSGTTAIIFAHDAWASATVTSDSQVIAQVPLDALTGRIRVVVRDQIIDASEAFRVVT